MSREPRHRRVDQCVVGPFQVNSFVEKACVTLATGAIGREKTKEMLKAMLVETSARTNAKGEQYELRSESVRVRMPKTRVLKSDLSGIRLFVF